MKTRIWRTSVWPSVDRALLMVLTSYNFLYEDQLATQQLYLLRVNLISVLWLS